MRGRRKRSNASPWAERSRSASGPCAWNGSTPFAVRTGSNARAILRDVADGTVFAPAKRVYIAREAPTTEASIRTEGVSQTYVSLGEVGDEGIVVRGYHKPWITLIWGGAVLMGFGGFLSLLDRRLRIGVANRPARAAA